MREYVIVHVLNQSIWSSLTIDPHDTHALVYQDGHLSTVAYDTASCILQYCTQSPDYLVEEIGAQRKSSCLTQ